MSSTERDSKKSLMSMAAVAAWRRRQEASSEVLAAPDDGEQHVNGYSLPDDEVGPANGRQQTNGYQLRDHAHDTGSDGDANRANGFHTNGHGALNGSTDSIERSFADSQQAGLTAIISLAQAPMPSQVATSPKPPVTQPWAPGSAGGRVDTAAPIRPVPVFIQPTQVIDRTRVPVRSTPVISGRLSAKRLQKPREARTARITRTFGRAPALALTSILAIQAVLSLRLVWSNTAFSDEALYLWSGNLEWAHWLHGTPIPAFSTYFSGAPVLYPPLAAIANSIGGLAGARLLSLCFMLGATALLYATTSRLFGRRAAAYGAAVFAVLGPVQVLGALATYDAMAVFLIALAMWLVIRAKGTWSELFLIASGLALAVADVAKYASALWTPVIIIIAALTTSESGWLRPVCRGVRLAIYIILPLAVALLRFGGKSYIGGILFTTLARQAGGTYASFSTVIFDSLNWIGIIFGLAALGTVIAFLANGRLRWICLTLTAAALLAPAHQAQIHIITSLHKHVVFGAWFAAIVAGYALAKASEVNKAKGWRVATVAAVLALFLGIPQTGPLFTRGWPNSTQMTTDLAKLLPHTGCPCLIAETTVVHYYLPATTNDLIVGPFAFGYWNRADRHEVHGIPAYQLAIHNRYFQLIEIDPAENPAVYGPISQALKHTSGYYLVDVMPIPHWGRSTIEIWRRSGK